MKHPSLGGGGAPPAMYTKQVLSDFSKIETLLKMVGTPKEILVDDFKRQWSECTEATAKDLQVVCGLKGMKRVEQTSILENFGGFLSGGGSSSSGMSGAAASSSGGFRGSKPAKL